MNFKSEKWKLFMLSLRKTITSLFLKNILLVVILLNGYSIVNAQEIPADFDHDDADFLLSGAHEKIACESCHVREVYKGIPQTCEECHNPSSLIAKTRKPNNHFESEDQCDNCHTSKTWAGARIDHDSVVGTCIDCHNNIITTGRASDHVQSVDECQECHTTRRWKQSGFDHAVITGNCFSCHNGSTASGKSEKHRLSNNQCIDCHTVENWKSSSFDHKGIKTACMTCHKDILPELPHPQETECENCHSVKKKWEQVRFKHEKTSDYCINCHVNRKTVNHFTIENDNELRCEDCHRSSSSWLSNVRFEHKIPDFHDHRVGTPCTSCHLSNARSVIFQLPQYRPTCGACHASSFQPSSHPKWVSTRSNYSLDDLSHCTISCHVYTDPTESTISQRRSANYHTTLKGNGITAP
jgi:hypothetical protein